VLASYMARFSSNRNLDCSSGRVKMPAPRRSGVELLLGPGCGMVDTHPPRVGNNNPSGGGVLEVPKIGRKAYQTATRVAGRIGRFAVGRPMLHLWTPSSGPSSTTEVHAKLFVAWGQGATTLLFRIPGILVKNSRRWNRCLVLLGGNPNILKVGNFLFYIPSWELFGKFCRTGPPVSFRGRQIRPDRPLDDFPYLPS